MHADDPPSGHAVAQDDKSSPSSSSSDGNDLHEWLFSDAFAHAFVATFSVIVVSELGDKTFFIAAIMAMRHPRTTVFAGAMAALAFMHVMSAFFG